MSIFRLVLHIGMICVFVFEALWDTSGEGSVSRVWVAFFRKRVVSGSRRGCVACVVVDDARLRPSSARKPVRPSTTVYVSN